MDLFPDGMHVRLRSAVHGTYLHADTDAVGVSLQPVRASLNVAWQVHRVVRDSIPYILLHNAANGRYLVATANRAPPFHIGRRVVQGVYEDPEATDVAWVATRIMVGQHPAVVNKVILRNIGQDRLLRANGRYWKRLTGVSVDKVFNRSNMMHWEVEPIPALDGPPIIRLPAETTAPPKGLRGLLHRPPPTLERTIRYVKADANGNFNEDAWNTFRFRGRRMFDLWTETANHTHDRYFYYQTVLCARAGRSARHTPLTIDLPISRAQMDVVSLTYRSPACRAKRYPNVEAP